MMAGSNMSLNPDIPEAHQLRGWYDSNGQGMTFHSFSSAGGQGGSGGSGGSDVVKPISAIKDEQLGMGEKVLRFTGVCEKPNRA